MHHHIRTYGLLLFILLISGNSCNKKDIDFSPVNISEDQYFKTELEFTKTVYGVYAKMTPFYNYDGGAGNALITMINLPGDDITTTASEPFEHFGSLQASDGRVATYYATCYDIISRANILLEKIEEEDGVYTTPNLKNYHKGEALFLRGLMFFNLWNYFGKSPVITKRVTDVSEWTAPESSGTELLDQAIADFTEAAGLLPASWPETDRGRATANAANGMLGKSLVFKATVNKSQPDFVSAITAFDKITGVKLVDNFADNTSVNTENNEESLFEFQASTSPGDNVWLNNEFDGVIGTMSAYWGFYNNHWSLFGAAPHIGTQKLVDAFDPADPRLSLTVDPATKAIQKYVLDDQASNSGAGSVNNPRILRYADVLLLKAEAVLQSGGSKADAIGLINQVRTRARNMGGGTEPADFDPAETDQATIMQWIMDERLRELAGEGQRWFDLRRWHIAGYITLNNAFFNPANADPMSFQAPKHLLFPIPLAETDRNPNVHQNPDY